VDPRVTGDADRFPVLSEAGREMLRFLREHPSAPIFRNQSGHKLTAAEIAAVRAAEADVREARVSWSPAPPWLPDFIARTWAEVPYFRRQGAPPVRLEDVAPTGRADLARDVAAFVPDGLPVDRLIQYATSGTTGHPLLVPSHPRVAAAYLAFHKRALDRAGVELTAGAGRVGVALLGFQKKCFTYASVTPAMDESGLVKLNLHPDDWRDPGDRARYLAALDAEVLSGDPISFAELLALDAALAPRALLSTAMALAPGLRERLAARFGCPVIDLYSMNEAGPIAALDPGAGGHVLLQPRLLVEILAADGSRLPPGERGEVTLTGGFNPYLPLLRYRTGDVAALDLTGAEPMLIGLIGRRPVRFRAADGSWKNNVDVSHALAPHAAAQIALHQAADGSFRLRARGGDPGAMRGSLAALFGAGARIEIAELAADDKVISYTSDLPGAEP
jgi:phenylacetate-CoA ligase